MKFSAAIALVLFGASLSAAEPTLRNLNIRGLQIGGTTTVILDGDDLGKAPSLLFPFPAKQTLHPKNTDKQATFDVSLPDDVTPGYHHLRVVTDRGVSLPLVIAVDRLPQRLFAASTEQLPIALHGAVNGSSTVETKFQGKAGQKVTVEVEARRLGGKLRPIVHLISPKKLELAWSWSTPTLFGDTRLEATLPEDGAYTITLHDAEYGAPAPSFFRLRVGQWSFVDQVFPSFVSKGKTPTVELLGQGPTLRGDMIASTMLVGPTPIPWPKGRDWSGPRPFVQVGANPEFVKSSDANKVYQELSAGPISVNGRLLAPDDEDRYRIPVTPLVKVKLEVFAERLGSPLDVALVIRNEKGVVLARGEDSPGSLDPVLEYAVPDKVTSLIVGVVDAQGQGGPRGVYRLTIDPQTPAIANSDFRLSTISQRLSLPAGGRGVIPVLIDRRGYSGPVDLAATALPSGVRLDGATIPAGADGALMTVERGDAPGQATIMTLRGRAADGNEQSVIVKGHPLERLQPWLATEIAVAPSNFKTTEFLVSYGNLPSDIAMVPGMKLNLPLVVTRADPKTAVKFSVLTSQATPLLNNQPDPNKAIRQEKPVELGEKTPTAEVAALMPVELAAPFYDIAVQAELLSPDKKTVLAVATTPVRRLPVRLPLVVMLDGAHRIETTVDPKKGGTVSIKGKIERREGLKGDVAIAVAGLPAGAKADAATVKADATVFAFNVVLPPNVAAGEIRGIKLVASAAPDPKTPAQRVKSKEADITLVVKTALK